MLVYIYLILLISTNFVTSKTYFEVFGDLKCSIKNLSFFVIVRLVELDHIEDDFLSSQTLDGMNKISFNVSGTENDDGYFDKWYEPSLVIVHNCTSSGRTLKHVNPFESVSVDQIKFVKQLDMDLKDNGIKWTGNCAYCILWKTPQKMKRIKWVMFNFHCWSTLLDLVYCCLMTPYLFVPAISGFPLGILRFIGISTKVQTFMGQAILGGFMTSMSMLFENRHNSLVTSRFKLNRKWIRTSYFAVRYLYAFFCLTPVYLKEIDMTLAQINILKYIPCPTVEFFNESIYVLREDSLLLIVCTLSFILVITTEITFFLTHSIYVLFSQTSTMSINTKKLQKKFLIGICIQVSIPFVAFFLPVFYFFFSAITLYYNQILNNVCILCISCHGILSTITLILINEPYRSFLKSKLKPKVSVNRQSSISILKHRYLSGVENTTIF